jgi:hypothetical protein
MLTDFENSQITKDQDELLYFVLDPAAPTGFSLFGRTVYQNDRFETITEQNGSTKIVCTKIEDPDVGSDGINPLPVGTIMRVMDYGNFNGDVPVWEVSADGTPINYQDYVVTEEGEVHWQKDTVVSYTEKMMMILGAMRPVVDTRTHRNEYRHTYQCKELLERLKFHPIRSTKTFQASAYTYKQVLEIVFRLAFTPRTIGNFAVVIKDDIALDVPNGRKNYKNSTLNDVVMDVARDIDMVPDLRLTFDSGVYTFTLAFIDKYGLEGSVTDISFFNQTMKSSVAENVETSADTAISNIENMITSAEDFPTSGAVYANETTDGESEGNWGELVLPYPIEDIEEVRLYWEWEVLKGSNSDSTALITLYSESGENPFIPSAKDGLSGWATLSYGNLLMRNPVIITKSAPATQGIYLSSSVLETDDPSQPGTVWQKSEIYLRDSVMYDLLPPEEIPGEATKKNTIYYTKGQNKLNLNGLNGRSRYWLEFRHTIGGTLQDYFSANNFSTYPLDYITAASTNRNKYMIAVKYRARIDSCIKGVNSNASDVTVFYNQYGQVVDVQSFGTGMNNYTKTMSGEVRTETAFLNLRANRGLVWSDADGMNIVKTERIVREVYDSLPKIGSSVVDNTRHKRYVVTNHSITRKKDSVTYIAQLTQSEAGKSRIIGANNRQEIAAIPFNDSVDSMSHTHIIMFLSSEPMDNRSSAGTYNLSTLLSAFNVSPSGVQPEYVKLNITTGEGDISAQMNILRARHSLSFNIMFRMLTNSVYDIERIDKDTSRPLLYTDSNGQLESIEFDYRGGGLQLLGFTQTLDKDAHEIMNHNTQVSWVGKGDLQLHDNVVSSSWLSGELTGDFELVLLSGRMRIIDDIANFTAARYALSGGGSSTGYYLEKQLMNPPSAFPEHVGYALLRGNKILLLDNFHILTDTAKITIYFYSELRQ